MGTRRLPGARNVRATLDDRSDRRGAGDGPDSVRDGADNDPDGSATGRASADGDRSGSHSSGDGSENWSVERVVVACPPHPQMGGDRHDGRLRAVSDALGDFGIDCLRFDYGSWDDGIGEQTDVRTALAWAQYRYDRVGLFGYSFGGSLAVLTCADIEAESDRASRPRADGDSGMRPDCLSVLAPGSGPGPFDVVGALDEITCPVQVVYGARDDVVEWESLVDRADELGYAVERMEADHFFIGQQTKAAERVASFFADVL